MNIREIRMELDLISREMYEVIIDTNFCQVGSTISWSNYQPGIYAGVNYLSQYRKVIDERQYSFMLSGGHALQIFYEWKGDGLTASKQAIYPAPYIVEGWKDEWPDFELSEAELLRDPDLSDNSSSDQIRASCWSHVRFDFDAEAGGHDVSHIQHSAINEFRVPSTIVLPPFMFMAMAIQLLLREYYVDVKGKNWFREAIARAKRQYVRVPVLESFYPFISVDQG